MAKASPSKKSKKRAPAKLSWQEEAQNLLNDLFKKSRSPQGGIFVLSQTGDVIFEAGKTKQVDKTSLGALSAALRGIKDELNHQLKTKGSWAQFGEDHEGFWVDYFENWIIVCIRIPYTAQWSKFHGHLKKYRRSGKMGVSTAEALSGLSEAAVDVVVGQGQE
ncbi:MAG: hypothetical protein EA369_02210 [Bradymonadales bacterium]|nr:MAG: hypothetical protein EA369_02210 [Bradymonadales bacterium]